MELEERIFYPVLGQSEDTRDKTLEAIEEHNLARIVLKDLSSLDIEDERWEAKMKVLQEVVNHHIEEEEKNTFKAARKILEKEQIQQITDQMMQEKSAAEKKAA
jgi:hypothetical protein